MIAFIGYLGIVVVACAVVAVCVILIIDFGREVHDDRHEARTLRDAVATFDIDFIPEAEDVAAAEVDIMPDGYDLGRTE